MSRKPALVTNAVLAPRRWMNELMTNVVPWLTRLDSPGITLAFSKQSRIPYEIIVSGRALRVDHLLGFMIEGDEIGEGAADIDGDCVSHCTLRLKWMNYKGCRMKKWSNGVLE